MSGLTLIENRAKEQFKGGGCSNEGGFMTTIDPFSFANLLAQHQAARADRCGLGFAITNTVPETGATVILLLLALTGIGFVKGLEWRWRRWGAQQKQKAHQQMRTLEWTAGVPLGGSAGPGPKTGAYPLSPRLLAPRQRIVIFPLERYRGYGANRE